MSKVLVIANRFLINRSFNFPRVELLPDKGEALQKELRELRLEISKVDTQIKLQLNELRPKPTMSKNPSGSNLGKHAVLLNELPGT